MLKSNKLASTVTAVLGVIIVILGIILYAETPNYTKKIYHYADNYNAEYASFGGEFYTYIYKASDTIVDELSDINEGIEKVVQAQNKQINAEIDTADAIRKSAAVIVISIGLSLIAFSLFNRGNKTVKDHITNDFPTPPQNFANAKIQVPFKKPTAPANTIDQAPGQTSHKWKCECGCMISEYPCPECGITEEEALKSYHL